MKNRKGFTMVELLAVITIMGILAGIGVVSIQRAQDKARVDFYKSQRSSLTSAATNYLNDHKNKYPKYVGQTTNIYLQDLQSGKYIGEFTDHSKAANSCQATSPDGTHVVVLRTDVNKFKYYTVLKCNAKTDKNIVGISATGSSITKNSTKLIIHINTPAGYKIKRYSYAIYNNNNANNIAIRTNTVTPVTMSNTADSEIDISDIDAFHYVAIYFVTTNERFGTFNQTF